MSVLEICQLRLKSSIDHTSPSILSGLIQERDSLREKVHDTKSRFYQSIEDPSIIYIFGVWSSLFKHEQFTSSPLKSEILKPSENMFDFVSMTHVPLDDVEGIPLDAPVMAIAKLWIKSGHVTRYEEVFNKYVGQLIEATKPYNVVYQWSVDAKEGKHESILLTGWEGIDQHVGFGKALGESYPDFAALSECYEEVEIRHARNMEK